MWMLWLTTTDNLNVWETLLEEMDHGSYGSWYWSISLALSNPAGRYIKSTPDNNGF